MREESNITLLEDVCQWAINISSSHIPEEVVALTKAQIFSSLGAVFSGIKTKKGRQIQKTYELEISPKYPFPYNTALSIRENVLALSQLASLIDYDEVILGGHTSQSVIFIPLVYGLVNESNGERILHTIIASNEIVGRISMSCALGSHRGQTACFVHQAGAAVAMGLITGCSAETISSGLQLSLSFITKIDGYAFLNTDVKILAASTAITHGLYCLDMAKRGFVGRINLTRKSKHWANHYALFPILGLFDDLGEFWYIKGLSVKKYPACAYMCSALEASEYLKHQYHILPDQIDEIIVEANLLQYGMDHSTEKLFNNDSPPFPAISFSSRYAISCIFELGQFGPSAYDIEETWPIVRQLYKKISVVMEKKYATESVYTDMPIGFSLNRVTLLKSLLFIHLSLLKVFGAKSYLVNLFRNINITLRYVRRRIKLRDHSQILAISKKLGAKVIIKTKSGVHYSKAVSLPNGFAGSGNFVDVMGLAKNKYEYGSRQFLERCVVKTHVNIIRRLGETVFD